MSQSTSSSSLPPPVALLFLGPSPSSSPGIGYLDLRGYRIHPQLTLSAPGPGSSHPHGWWRYNFVPIAPRSILHTQSHHSSHITPHSLSGQVVEAAPSRPTGSSVTCCSEWMTPSASETMASEWRFYHTCRLWPWAASGHLRASVPHVQNGTVIPSSQVGSRSQLTRAGHSVWPREGKRQTFIQ